jgi:hypothetical protein
MNEIPNPAYPPPPPAVPPPPPPVQPGAYAAPVVFDKKSPGLAGFLSMFPGLGHVYLGLYQRAFAIGGAFILGIALTSHGRSGEFFGPVLGFLWFFAIIDAVRQAKAINRGQLAEAGFAGDTQLKRAASGTGSLTWGVILVGLGSLWLADRYLDLERFWDFVGDWGGPLAIIVLGLVLIATHVRKKRKENEAGIGMPPRSTS